MSSVAITAHRLMTPSEFQESLQLLRLNDLEAATCFGLSTRQISFYRFGSRVSKGVRIPTPVPTPLALLIRLMLRLNVDPDDLR